MGKMGLKRFGMRFETLGRGINEIRQIGREVGQNRKGEERLCRARKSIRER